MSSTKPQKTLLHEVPVALYEVLVRCSFARRSCGPARGKELGPYRRANAEKGMERVPRPAAIEAEHELVEVVLEVRLAQSVVDAQTPALEV